MRSLRLCAEFSERSSLTPWRIHDDSRKASNFCRCGPIALPRQRGLRQMNLDFGIIIPTLARKAFSRGGGMLSEKAMRSSPSQPATAFAPSRTCCKAVKMRGTCSLKTCPASDKRALREVRMNNRTPRSSSCSLIARNTAIGRCAAVPPHGRHGVLRQRPEDNKGIKILSYCSFKSSVNL